MLVTSTSAWITNEADFVRITYASTRPNNYIFDQYRRERNIC